MVGQRSKQIQLACAHLMIVIFPISTEGDSVLVWMFSVVEEDGETWGRGLGNDELRLDSK